MPCFLTGDVDSAYTILTEKTGLIKWIDLYSEAIYFDNSTSRYRIRGTENEGKHWREILLALANPGQVGEMYSSAAPYDPLFWIVHPTAERLLHYRKLRATTGVTFDETWGYTTDDAAASDTGLVCDWDSVESRLPECTMDECSGHGQNDTLSFKVDGKYWSNQDFYDMYLSPTSEESPYLYENFGYTACDSQGISFGAAEDEVISI